MSDNKPAAYAANTQTTRHIDTKVLDETQRQNEARKSGATLDYVNPALVGETAYADNSGAGHEYQFTEQGHSIEVTFAPNSVEINSPLTINFAKVEAIELTSGNNDVVPGLQGHVTTVVDRSMLSSQAARDLGLVEGDIVTAEVQAVNQWTDVRINPDILQDPRKSRLMVQIMSHDGKVKQTFPSGDASGELSDDIHTRQQQAAFARVAISAAAKTYNQYASGAYDYNIPGNSELDHESTMDVTRRLSQIKNVFESHEQNLINHGRNVDVYGDEEGGTAGYYAQEYGNPVRFPEFDAGSEQSLPST